MNKQDYNNLRSICEKNSRLSKLVVDDFLLGYAAGHRGLEKKMENRFGWYRDILDKYEKESVNLFKSQYIMHRVFRKDGLIHQLMKLPALQRFKGEEQAFLRQQAEVPWRLSFAKAREEPEKGFFLMHDIFSDEQYMLYSEGMHNLKASGDPLLWLNLVGYNGSCWQTYGPITPFRAMGAEDIYFFATEKNPDIEDEQDVPEDIEKDPLPYMLLSSGAEFPRTFHDNDEIQYQLAEHDLANLDTKSLKQHFTSEYTTGVYRFTHQKFGSYPHFAQIYYDEQSKIVLFTALTEKGFRQLVADFNACGYDFPAETFMRIRPQIIPVAESILKHPVTVNEYADFFETEEDEGSNEELREMNEAIKLMLPDINESREPDLEAVAKKTGVSIDAVRRLKEHIVQTIDKVPAKPGGAARQHPAQETSKPTHSAHKPAGLFKKIYGFARTIRDLKPWERLFESDLFGIQMPGSGRVYFISVMGSGGEYPSVAAYIGYEGLFGLYEMWEEQPARPAEALMTTPHLLVSFSDRSDLQKEDLEAIKLSGEQFRGAGNWPMLQEIVPGYVPAFPSGEVLEELPVLLEQVAGVLSRAVEDPDLLYDTDNDSEADPLFMRIPSGKTGRNQWMDRFEEPDPMRAMVTYRVDYDRTLAQSISRRKVKDMVVQAELFMLPNPVMDKGPRGYFPFVLLLVDRESGMVLGMNMLSPDPDLRTMYEHVAQKLLEALDKLEGRPRLIEMQSEQLSSLTAEALEKASCKISLKTRMAAMEDAINGLLDHLG